MGMVISIYSEAAFKEYILPSINNADYAITLRSNYFHIKEDLQLKLEVLEGLWYIRQGIKYSVIRDDASVNKQVLIDKEILSIKISHQEEISLIVKEIRACFHSYKKYMLRGIGAVSIGKEEHNDICYDYLGMVSRNHAKIVRHDDGYYIENTGLNGVYVDSVHINDSTKLKFGSFINIMGLHMVFLGDMIAVDENDQNVIVNESLLVPYVYSDEATMYLGDEKDAYASEQSGQTLYHRAPRNYEKLTSDTIEIEAPPARSQTKKQPLFMTIGPSATMSLPMLLGCLLMVYSNSRAGNTASLYMYSGLVMSVASAGIGISWTLANLKYQKKEEKAVEEHRFQAYSEYLVEKTEEIRDKYDDTIRRLEETYPSTEICLNYDEKKGVLWNRNYTHDDFLKHRLGIGEFPFQYVMDIPKKQFSLYKDELSDKPAFIKENYKTLIGVPITVDLLEKKLIGIVGGRGKAGAVKTAQILSVQLAANNCYTDVKFAYIYNNASSADYGNWDFAKWFPHVWSEDKKTRFVAASKEDAVEVFYELTRIFRSREEAADKDKSKIKKPYYIVFISDISMLEGEPFAKYAFSGDERYGLTTILLAENHEALPNDCEFIIENSDDFMGMYDVYEGKNERQKIKFDDINLEKLCLFARHLSSLCVPEIEEGGDIVNSITFFEMFNINRIEEYPVKEMWAKSRTYENIKGLLGQRAGGAPCYLDVHEKYHGPHGLVAGITGSGKSETLQTYILSLAINYSPDDIGFFIIDYKGGGMANLFDGLPHMVGQISNLSGNQVKRAMISIKSENRRRQRVFTEHGVNNINLYTKLYKNGEALSPVPHLFIIIDEFAELKREEPEFMRELISVAQVGRSLGVHLILATQKPAGTVDDNIWSNSKFRICLRVQDQQDSKDMLHKPDAAYITQAGRGYLQVGNDEIYELFQSGFSGAVFDENMVSAVKETAKLITTSGKVDMTGNSVKLSQKQHAEEIWVDALCKCMNVTLKRRMQEVKKCRSSDEKLGILMQGMYETLKQQQIDYSESDYNNARLKDFISMYMEALKMKSSGTMAAKIIRLASMLGKKLPQAKEKTQLDVTKEYLHKVAVQNGYTHKISLWMPVLRDHIYLDEFSEFEKSRYQNGQWREQDDVWNLSIVVGQMDDPANQNQMPLLVDFAEQGHIAVCGVIVSGKSTLLQTLIYGLIHKFSPAYVNIYALDFSSKMLSAFEEAPHMGGIMYENDMVKISKFFNMLGKMVQERKELFKGGNYKQYVQRNGVKLPAIMIFIDNYASFKEKTEGIYEQQMIQISKEGVSLGIYIIVTGNGFGFNDISNRVGENIETILCLSLPDKYAYGELLHNMHIEVEPEAGIKGRGLAYYGSEILEYQAALSLKAENDYQRMENIQSICEDMKAAWKGKVARKIPEIPKIPTWSLFTSLERYQELERSKDFVPIGYDEANADVYAVSLKEIYCYLICGAGRTGKTNLMKVMIQSVMGKNSHVCILESSKRDFKAYEKYKQVTCLSEENDIFEYFKNTLTPEFQKRNKVKNTMLNEEYDENEVYMTMREEQPYFIFISDMSWFIRLIYKSEFKMSGFMETLISRGRYHNIYFVAELSLSKIPEVRGYQLYESFIEYKTGIHLGGKTTDNNILPFEYMAFKERAVTDKAGVGTLPGDSNYSGTKKVVVPLARK